MDNNPKQKSPSTISNYPITQSAGTVLYVLQIHKWNVYNLSNLFGEWNFPAQLQAGYDLFYQTYLNPVHQNNYRFNQPS